MQNWGEQMNDWLANDQTELSHYLDWQWPEHIEKVLHKMLWVSLVESAENLENESPHTHLLRRMISEYHETPPEILDVLSTVDDVHVLVAVAENPQCQPGTLSKLAKHQQEQVQAAVADNPLTPADSLLWLAKNAGLDVKHAMAENSAMPSVVLQELSEDDNAYVSQRAGTTLSRRRKSSVSQLPARKNAPTIRKAM
jgi:hypothetical protein